MSYYLPLALAVLGNLLYHLSQRMTPSSVHPLLTVGVSFAAASALCLGGFAIVGGQGFAAGLRQLSWTTLGLAAAITAIEAAVLVAYRAGWPMGVLSLVVTAAQTALLIPMGRMLFGERLPATSWAGVAFCLAGLALICLRRP